MRNKKAFIREANMQHKATAEEMYGRQVGSEDSSTGREAFWDGFWSVFRNPAVTYCIGLMIGFVGNTIICVLIK